jgi:YVTN family beta-propeller protein
MRTKNFLTILLVAAFLTISLDQRVAADTILTSVPTGTTPARIAVNQVTNKIYVTNFNGASVTVINGADNTVTNIPVGETPTNIAVNYVTNKIYIVNQDSDSVTVIDGVTNQTVTIPVGSQPAGIAVNTVTNKIYVANAAFNTPSNMTVIDGASNATSTIVINRSILTAMGRRMFRSFGRAWDSGGTGGVRMAGMVRRCSGRRAM